MSEAANDSINRLSELTLEEKASLCLGSHFWYTAPVERLGIPRIMVSVNMLDTGFDFPEVVNLVMARFTKSAILYQQMRGRGARRAGGQ